MSSTPSEFQIIKRYFEGVGDIDSNVIELGIGDDCAIISPPVDKSLCFSLDTMVEGRHFPKGISPQKLAVRAMAAALSDLAAMGAEPSFFTLSLTIPESDSYWLEGFSKGLKLMADRYCLSLVGGDTTRGPLSVGIQVHGFVESGQAMQRSGAGLGDFLVVTGNLGDAGAALQLLDRPVKSDTQQYLLDRYYSPTPRFKEAAVLRRYATSCIDISDGLFADARHIAEASNCGLRIDMDALPLSKQLVAFAGESAVQHALNSGDDYELLCTIPELEWERLDAESDGVQCTVIGCVVPQIEGVSLYRGEQKVLVESEGFKHFE